MDIGHLPGNTKTICDGCKKRPAVIVVTLDSDMFWDLCSHCYSLLFQSMITKFQNDMMDLMAAYKELVKEAT